MRKFVYQQTSTNGLGFVVLVKPVLDRRFLFVAFNMCGPNGTDLLGLDGGVPNGDPGLLFSLLVSGEFASSRLLCANFFFRACAMIEAGSLPPVETAGFLRGVPPGDLWTVLSLTFPNPLSTSAMFGKVHPLDCSAAIIPGARDNLFALFC